MNAQASTDAQRIAKLDQIIGQLIDNALSDAIDGKTGLKSYSLDSGQSKIETNYRSISEMASNIKGIIKLRNMLVSKTYGTRSMKLRRWNVAGEKLGRII